MRRTLVPAPSHRKDWTPGEFDLCLPSLSQKHLLPSEDSMVLGPKLAEGQLFLCPLTPRVKVKPICQQIEKKNFSLSLILGRR